MLLALLLGLVLGTENCFLYPPAGDMGPAAVQPLLTDGSLTIAGEGHPGPWYPGATVAGLASSGPLLLSRCREGQGGPGREVLVVATLVPVLCPRPPPGQASVSAA